MDYKHDYLMKRKSLFGIDEDEKFNDIDGLFQDFMDMTFRWPPKPTDSILDNLAEAKKLFDGPLDYDVKVEKGLITYEFPLPKFAKEEVEISFDPDTKSLSIGAIRKPKSLEGWSMNMTNIYRRTISLKDFEVDDKYITASLSDGVLTVEVPATKIKAKTKCRTIEVK